MKNKLLILAMYDLKVKNIAPARRMSAIIETFNELDIPFISLSGSRKERRKKAWNALFSYKFNDVSGVYVESSNSGMLITEFVLLMKYKLKKIPISVYIRDIYPKYKQYWLWKNYRVVLAHLFWLASYFVYKMICEIIYIPSTLIAQKLSLDNYKILPPGLLGSEKNLGKIKQNSIFYAGGTGPQYDIECLLFACKKLSKEINIIVTFLCRKDEIEKISKWQSESWFSILNNDLEQLDFQPQIAVIPLTNTEYGDLSFPVKLMDYISINTPILASDSFVIKNFINEHQIGLIAKSEDVDDYYEKIKIMLEDRNLYEELLANVYKLQKNPEISWEYKCKTILKDLGFEYN